MNFLKRAEQYFEFRERNTGWNFELIGGVTTFLTMSYIIFLQPMMLSGAFFGQPTGMNQMALFTSVCLASALGSFFMGVIAKYPVALAPAMGANVLFVLTLLPILTGLMAKMFFSSWLRVLLRLPVQLQTVSTPL